MTSQRRRADVITTLCVTAILCFIYSKKTLERNARRCDKNNYFNDVTTYISIGVIRIKGTSKGSISVTSVHNQCRNLNIHFCHTACKGLTFEEVFFSRTFDQSLRCPSAEVMYFLRFIDASEDSDHTACLHRQTS